MPTKKDTVRDLEPKKDAKGGGGSSQQDPPEGGGGGTIKIGDTIKKPQVPAPDRVQVPK